MLENMVRICKAKFGTLYLHKENAYRQSLCTMLHLRMQMKH